MCERCDKFYDYVEAQMIALEVGYSLGIIPANLLVIFTNILKDNVYKWADNKSTSEETVRQELNLAAETFLQPANQQNN